MLTFEWCPQNSIDKHQCYSAMKQIPHVLANTVIIDFIQTATLDTHECLGTDIAENLRAYVLISLLFPSNGWCSGCSPIFRLYLSAFRMTPRRSPAPFLSSTPTTSRGEDVMSSPDMEKMICYVLPLPASGLHSDTTLGIHHRNPAKKNEPVSHAG